MTLSLGWLAVWQLAHTGQNYDVENGAARGLDVGQADVPPASLAFQLH